ncbi:MAG: methyltransferase domain-containing protein [Bacteroidetes bacterium]|nr:MAG: methyltransferase domain-containing protein [Bacteroidota bacterium]
MASYDKYYETPDLFGAAFPALLEFFEKEKKQGKVLDLGCGQGRNAIPVARLGFEVTGVDISEVGIEQMLGKAAQEELNVQGICHDIYTLEIIDQYDYILLDSMFHFTKKDKVKEVTFIRKIIHDLRPGAVLCICIQDTGKKVSILKSAVAENDVNLKEEVDFTYTFEDPGSDHSSKTSYKFLTWTKGR